MPALFALCSLLLLANAGVVETLVGKIADEQVQKGHDEHFPFVEEKMRGLYASKIHLNFRGPEDDVLLRRSFQIFDDNVFVSLWNLETLFEAEEFGGTLVSQEAVELATRSIVKFKDRNDPESSRCAFWIQTETPQGAWECAPRNLISIVKSGLPVVGKLTEFLKKIGLKSFEEKAAILAMYLKSSANAFRIPPDADDSMCNVGFGAALHKRHPKVFEVWRQAFGKDLPQLYADLKTFSYRPFANDSSSIIDPRTYFVLHEYLEGLEASGDPLPDLQLVTTWMSTFKGNEKMFFKGVAMPFNVNNVDFTVMANVLHGLTRAALSPALPTPPLDAVFSSIVRLFVYGFSSGKIAQRPDIALLYYPSFYSFYWFASRSLNEVNVARACGQTIPPMLAEKIGELQAVLQRQATDQILDNSLCAGALCSWSEFLGLYDETPHRDDALFSTSSAVNFLLNVWSEVTACSPRRIQLRDDTPPRVATTLKGAIQWLKENSLSASPMNSFFTGSVKSGGTMPLHFPADVTSYINGSFVDPHNGFPPNGDQVAVGIRGVMPPAEYRELWGKEWFGEPFTGANFTGYNQTFPFWSADSFSWSAAVLALVKGEAAVGN